MDSSSPIDPHQSYSCEVTELGAKRRLHFRDARSPHCVQFALERWLMVLFSFSKEDNLLCMRATAMVVGARYDVLLRFDAALPAENYYTFEIVCDWSRFAAGYQEYFSKTSESWFRLWTSDLVAASPLPTQPGTRTLYEHLCEQAMTAEAQLETVAAIQQSIVASVKAGAWYGNSHKEGATKIFWSANNFVREDIGDYPDHRRFTDEDDFLKMLYNFCQQEVTRHTPRESLSELMTWRLISRLAHATG